MTKITSVEELKKLKQSSSKKIAARQQGEDLDNLIQIYVGMEESGINAGAKQIYHQLWTLSQDKDIVVLQTNKIGNYKEPVVKVILPEDNSEVIFEQVTEVKANEIISNYIEKKETVDGMILINN